jgi:transposase
MSMYVCYSDAQGRQHTKEYAAFTSDLQRMATELKEARVTQVSMEATGVYWTSLYELLEANGMQVTLINARHYKNVAAQKTDVKDCQWIHQLHAHGLLRSSHIAEECYRRLRTYIQERDGYRVCKSDTLNRIHKVLTQMNIKWQHVISDIEGVEGMKVLRRIAAGERNAEALLQGVNIHRLKAEEQVLLNSLQGIGKEEHYVLLRAHLQYYDFCQQQMCSFEHYIEATLQQIIAAQQPLEVPPAVAAKKKRVRKNQYHFNVKAYLLQLTGVDLTAVDGLDEVAVLSIISVVGTDVSKWPTAEHFTSWLNLAARPQKSGGRVLGHQRRFTNNKATQAFRLAAQTMWQNKGPLGRLYRRLAATKGPRKAAKALARRLAVIVYCMLKHKRPYDPQLTVTDEEKLKAKKLAHLRREAAKLGYTVESIAA